MPYKVCTSTNPSEDRAEEPSVHQHVVDELFRWLECTNTNQANVANKHQHHFTHQRVNMKVHAADGLEVRDSSWDVDCLSFPVMNPDKSYDLENMFAHAMDPFAFTCSETQCATREALKTLPETLLVKLDRQVPTGRASPHPVVDPVLCDAPVTFPDVIDFGDNTNGFSKPLHESCVREPYKLVGILMGRGNAGSERWAYGFCHVKKRWGEVRLDVENKKVFMNMHDDDAAVRQVRLGETEQTGGYVLKLYYQRQPNLPSKLNAAIKLIDHTQRFDTIADVMGLSPKECTRVLQKLARGANTLPQILVGYTIFELHCMNMVPWKIHCMNMVPRKAGTPWRATDEELELLRKTIRNEWSYELDGETKGRWMANAARCNQKHAKGLTPFRTMSAPEVFREQWMLTMMCGEKGAEASVPRTVDAVGTWCKANTLWLGKQCYFEQLWEVLHPEYRNWFVRMAKERNSGAGISQEQGMMELWDNYKFVLCAFLIPGSVEWREAGAALLRENARTSRAKLREHFIGVLPEWKKQCDAASGLARLLRRDNAALHEAMHRIEGLATTSRPTASVKVNADGAAVVQHRVTKEVDVAWKPTGTDCGPFSKNRHETLHFKLLCAMCNTPNGFTAQSIPGAEKRVQCHSCKGVMTVTLPDTRVMEAEMALCRYVQMVRARKDLKRLRARRDLCLKTMQNIFNMRDVLRPNVLHPRPDVAWRRCLPVLEKLEKDPAFDPDKLNPTMVNVALTRLLKIGASAEEEEEGLLPDPNGDDEQPATHVPSPPPPLAREYARERLEPHVMSAPPPFDRGHARERPIPQMARRVDAFVRQSNGDDDTQEVWHFTVCCVACHKTFEFRSPRTPGQKISLKCHRCGNVLSATIPDQRRLAATSLIDSYVLVFHARKQLRRLRKAAQARADAEARAAQRAAEEAAQRAARAARDAEMCERWRQENERAAAARAAAAERQAAIEAAVEAREAERIEANRAAHADFLRRQEEAQAARQQAAQAEAEAAAPAVAAARQERRELRAARNAARASKKKWVDPFKVEEARREAHIKAENDRKREAADAAQAAEAAVEARRQAAREAAQIAQAEAAARTAEAEARAAARAAVRDAEREYQRSCERVDANSETTSKLVCDSAMDQEAERLIEVAVEAYALAFGAVPATPVASPPDEHVQGWAEAAKNVQQTLREVADADIAAREAEDLDMAIAASLETADVSLPGESSSSAASSSEAPVPPVPPQFKNAPSRKQLKRLNQKPCWYFARGKCRYGDECQFLHVATHTAPEAAPEAAPAPAPEAAPAPAPEPAPAPALDKDDAGANTKCIICFEGDKDVVCLPCRHQCACSGCLDVVRRFGTCPMCRQPIAQAFSVFIA